MGRTFVVIGIIVVALACAAQGPKDERLQQNINENFGCLPLAELMPKLTEKTGVKFSVDHTIENWMVFLWPRDRPLFDVMNQLAKVFDLTWYQDSLPESPRYALKPNPEQKRKIENVSRARKAAEIENAKQFVDALVKALKVPQGERDRVMNEYLKPPDQRIHDFGADIPGYAYGLLSNYPMRIAIEVAEKWKDNDWWKLVDEGTLVYSTKPSAKQRQLHGLAMTDLVGWNDSVKDTPVGFSVGRRGEYRIGGSHANNSKDTEIDRFKVLFHYSEQDGFSIDAMLLNRANHPFVQMNDVQMFMIDRTEHKPDPWCSNDSVFDRPFEIPSDLAKLGDTGTRAFPNYYRKWLNSHEKREFLEPLSIVVQPLLTAIASHSDRSVITPVCDCMLTLSVPANAKTIKQALANWYGYPMVMDADSHWMYGRPQPLSNGGLENFLDTANRGTLKKLYEILYPNHAIPLDTIAEVWNHLTFPQTSGLRNVLGRCYDDLVINFVPVQYLKLWASLDPVQKTRATKDGLAVSGLRPDQRQLVVECLTSASWNIFDPTDIPSQLDTSDVTVSFPKQDTVPYAMLNYNLQVESFSYGQFYPPGGMLLGPINLAVGSMIDGKEHFAFIYDAEGWFYGGWISGSDAGEVPGAIQQSATLYCFRIRNRDPIDPSNPDTDFAKAVEKAKREYEKPGGG